MDEETSLKIGIFGESTVGKTSILKRYFDNKFSDKYEMTVNAEIFQKNLNIGENEIYITVWDTMGQERFSNLTRNYFQGLDGILLVYDKSEPRTFDRLSYWITNIKENSDMSSMNIVLVGNKTDLPPEKIKISEEKGREEANKHDFKFIETSAKEGTNLSECFNLIVEEILKRMEINKKTRDKKLKLNQKKGKKRKCCK